MATKKEIKVTPEEEIVEANPPVSAPMARVEEEATMKISDVKKLIAEAIRESKETPVRKAKPVSEHWAHVWRLDAKWVVDFKDRNTDEYVKTKIHAFIKYNASKREDESWVEVVFEDGSTKEISLPSYVKNRVLVYCPIIERNKIDMSYSMGQVERKKEVNDKLVGTGVMMDQTVERYEEVFKVRTPDGKILTLSDYIIA